MAYLLTVSVIWAFSFGLVKSLGSLDPSAVAVVRIAISLVVFLPFFRPSGLGPVDQLRLAAIGVVQFGLLYVFYLRSYAHLKAYEVALFTITTPIFVAGLDAVLARAWHPRYLAAALLSVAGAAVILGRAHIEPGSLGGFVLVQLSNACFAAGQLAWRRERLRLPARVSDASVFALPYAGGLLLTLGVSALQTRWSAFAPTPAQWATLAYLGAVASGLAFFLWNVGASRVNAGVLAAFNNIKIPLGIACSIVLFGERADVPRLFIGGGLMVLGVWTARSRAPQGNASPQVRAA